MKPIHDRLAKLFAMLGSDNAGERENARTLIDEILRRNRKSWNDLTELLQTGAAGPDWTIDDAAAPPANAGAGVTALDIVQHLLEEYSELGSPHEYIAVALWVLHSHVYSQFVVTPRLALVSPVRGCGKTSLLALLELLTARGRRDDSTTAAALLRLISREHCTLLLDEADNLGLGRDGILRAVINSGHRRGGSRTLLHKGEPKRFATHAPLAIASIGILPLPIMHRSLVIHMRRATRTLRQLGVPDPAIDVAYSMARAWAREVKLNPDPELPSELRNRLADNWRVLIAVADSFGRTWSKRARQAAVHFSRAYHDEDLSVILLNDIRCVFDSRGATKFASATLVEALVEMDSAPWADWRGLHDDQRPRTLTQSELARLLAPFGIRPQTIWPQPRTKRTKSSKGYTRAQFELAWRQFCDSAGTPAHENNTGRLQRNGAGTKVTM